LGWRGRRARVSIHRRFGLLRASPSRACVSRSGTRVFVLLRIRIVCASVACAGPRERARASAPLPHACARCTRAGAAACFSLAASHHLFGSLSSGVGFCCPTIYRLCDFVAIPLCNLPQNHVAPCLLSVSSQTTGTASLKYVSPKGLLLYSYLGLLLYSYLVKRLASRRQA